MADTSVIYETPQLPSEIIEKILLNFDGKSLLLSRAVCKQWQAIVDSILDRFTNDQWHRLALETIPYNTILEYVKDGHPPYVKDIFEPVNDPSAIINLSAGLGAKRYQNFAKFDWQAIFRKHQILSNPFLWENADVHTISVEDYEDNPVTCAKVNGDVVVTGHINGLICMWAHTHDLLMICDKCQYSEVTDIIFGDVYKTGPYVLNKNCNEEEIFVNNHFMVTAGLDGQVSTRSLSLTGFDANGKIEGKLERIQLDRHREKWVYISIIGNILATFSRDNSVMLWDIVAPAHFPKEAWKLPRFLPVRSINGASSRICCGRIWPNKVAFWQQKLVTLTRSGFNQTSVLSQSLGNDPNWISIPQNTSGKMTLVTDLIQENETKKIKDKRLVTITSNDDIFNPGRLVKDKKFLSLSSKDLYETFGFVSEQYSKMQLDLKTVTVFTKIFRDDLYVILNRRRQLLISVDGRNFRICGPFKDEYKGHVTAVNFYANVFVIGFDSGHFWVFFSKGPFDLLCMNIEEEPHFESQVDRAICDIDVSPGKGLDVRVAIATCESVKLFVIEHLAYLSDE